jgi:hypothetical protein
MPEPKDAIIGILGASVALAGLILVFSGLLYTQSAAFPRDTTDDIVIDRFKRAARLAFWPFLLWLLDAAASVSWLLCPTHHWIYTITWAGFFIMLAVTTVYAFGRV